jgi:glyoxylase-like metal-dependent hydrolase (beta-lactamase superfamily II)
MLAMALSIYPISTGQFFLDGGGMFGVVPRVLWQQQYPPDDQNRIKQALRTLLIIDGDRKIIVDAGVGNWHEPKFLEIYGMQNYDFDFDSALASYNLTTEDITDLILTHLHFDHAGGMVTRVNNQIIPTFPKASIWLQKEQLDWAQNPSPKDRASFMEVYLKPLFEYPGLELLEGKKQITDNVSVIPVHGHTPAMQTVIVETQTEKHFFPSDLVPTAAHLHIPYVAAYDNNSVMVTEEKKQILAQACREKWIVYFCHDPYIEKGRVICEAGKFAIEPN